MNKKGGKETILIVFLDSHTQFPIIWILWFFIQVCMNTRRKVDTHIYTHTYSNTLSYLVKSTFEDQ